MSTWWRQVAAVSLTFNVLGVTGAGVVAHKKGGIPWLLRQVREVKTGSNGPAGNLRLSVFERCPDSPNDIYMVGDSLVSGCEWGELVGAKNRGIPGDTTAGVLSRLDEITAGQPQTVYLMIGINDLQTRQPIEATLARYRQIVTRIRAVCPQTQIIAQSVLPVNVGLYRQYITCVHPEAHMPTIDEVQALNEGIRAIEGTIYLDLWPVMVKNGQLKYTYDGLHVNGEGYVSWAGVIRAGNTLKCPLQMAE